MLVIDYLVKTLEVLPQNFKVQFSFGITPMYNQESTDISNPNEYSSNDIQTLSLHPTLGEIAPIFFANKGNSLVYNSQCGQIDIIDSKNPMTVKELLTFLKSSRNWSNIQKKYSDFAYYNFDDFLDLPKSMVDKFKINKDFDEHLNPAFDDRSGVGLYDEYTKGDFYITVEKPNRVIINLKIYASL